MNKSIEGIIEDRVKEYKVIATTPKTNMLADNKELANSIASDLKKQYKVVGTLDFDSQTATGIIAEVNEMVFKIIAASSDKKHEISIREL